jgi:hypothetical protein
MAQVSGYGVDEATLRMRPDRTVWLCVADDPEWNVLVGPDARVPAGTPDDAVPDWAARVFGVDVGAGRLDPEGDRVWPVTAEWLRDLTDFTMPAAWRHDQARERLGAPRQPPRP